MINKDKITMESNLGTMTNNTFLTHGEGSKNLVVLFPGGDNSTDIPTLHYSRKGALLTGCDVLSLEYGSKIGLATLDKPEIINIIIDECCDVINKCLNNNYDKFFFISKSIGNVISFGVDEKLNDKNIEYICYTPISLNIQHILKRKCIVFSGIKDKLLTNEDRNILLNHENTNLIEIENAGHSLEIDDSYLQSIEILIMITNQCVDYISERMRGQ